MVDHSTHSSHESPLMAWVRRMLPTFWTVIIVVGFASTTVNLAINHPDKISGWRAVGLGVLMFGLLAAYRRISSGRIYSDDGISERQATLLIRLQLFALFLLIRGYDVLFIWFSLSVLYQIIGGLSQRRWPLLLIGLAAVLIISLLPNDTNRAIDIGFVLVLAVNIGIALFIRSMNKRHDNLNATFERLRQAYSALTVSAAESEEMAVLRERARIARAMHDEVGHALVVINVKLEAAQLLYAHDTARGDAELEATRALIRRTMTDLRHTLADLRATVVDYDNLPAALERLAQETQTRTGINISVCIPADISMPTMDVRQALWYVAREALTNVEKHSSAKIVTITFESTSDGWLLIVEDNGASVQLVDLDAPGHYGVLGMRERMYALGGNLTVQQGAKGGTIVEAHVPRTVKTESL